MPSKFSKKNNLKSHKRIDNRFTLHKDTDFKWLDYKFTVFFAGFLALIHAVGSLSNLNSIFFEISPSFVSLFALNNFLVLTSVTEWYRMISSLLIHANILHLGGNILFFVIFAIRLEELKGGTITFSIFLVAGIVGNLLTLLIFGNNPLVWSLGASGGINGLFAANLVTMRKQYNKGALSMLFFLVFFSTLTIAGPNTNFFAHFGGLVGGGLLMYFLDEYYDKIDDLDTFTF
jgi:membrane associated rhomboid family serine protease